MKNDVIACISTPLGRGAVAIVRLSGEGCLEVALNIFSFKNKKINDFCEKYKKNEDFCEKNSKKTDLFQNLAEKFDYSELLSVIKPRYMHFGKVRLEEGDEECLMVFFNSPFSYTGEDVVEFQIHGGVLVAQKVLNACLNAGARLAEAGEFSKRAFLNGKISLDKAEAIIGEINAESEGELRSSLQVTSGQLSETVENLQEKIKLLLAELEVGMDYPDETDETKLRSNIWESLNEVQKEIEKILQNSEGAKYLKNGINVALVGKTNVGKSSIMNSLLGENRAIVTDIQGTTRDVISESFVFRGIKINLFDTAGIRETNDIVENLGIERSKNSALTCDLVLFVLDGSEEENEEDKQIEKLINNKKHIFVVNKTDKKRVLSHKNDEIEISALSGKGIEELKQKILDLVEIGEISQNTIVVTNERQHEILKNSQAILDEILSSKNQTLDVLAINLQKLWKTLGKITGKTENEDIIDLIFSKFCLGK